MSCQDLLVFRVFPPVLHGHLLAGTTLLSSASCVIHAGTLPSLNATCLQAQLGSAVLLLRQMLACCTPAPHWSIGTTLLSSAPAGVHGRCFCFSSLCLLCIVDACSQVQHCPTVLLFHCQMLAKFCCPHLLEYLGIPFLIFMKGTVGVYLPCFCLQVQV